MNMYKYLYSLYNYERFYKHESGLMLFVCLCKRFNHLLWLCSIVFLWIISEG